jgi:hypothetical protein
MPTATPNFPAFACGHYWLEAESKKRGMCGSCCTKEYARTHHNAICALCGGGMRRSPKQLAKSKRNFCSIKCRNGFYKPKVFLKCIRCKKQYERTHAAQVYCSLRCQADARTISVPLPCDNCGVMMRKHPSQIVRYKRHFCGNECANKARVLATPNTQCSVCAKPIYRKPKQLSMHPKHYCTFKCMGIDKRKEDGRYNSRAAATGRRNLGRGVDVDQAAYQSAA